MIAIIFESNQQAEFEAMSTKINEHLKIAIPTYKADNYCLWARAAIKVVTNQRAFKIKPNIQTQIEGGLTTDEVASIVTIPSTDEDWFPIPDPE